MGVEQKISVPRELIGRHSLSQLTDFRMRQRNYFENPSEYPYIDGATLAKISDRAIYRIAQDVSESGVDSETLADLLPRKKMPNAIVRLK